MTREQSTDRENYVVLAALQASLGLISQHVVAITLSADPDHITLYFAMTECDDSDREDVEDIVGDLDALVEGDIQIDADIHIGADDEHWAGYGRRCIYRAHL